MNWKRSLTVIIRFNINLLRPKAEPRNSLWRNYTMDSTGDKEVKSKFSVDV